MTKAKQKQDPKAMRLVTDPTDTLEQTQARAALQPSVNAVAVIDAYQGNIMGKDVDITEMVDTLRGTVKDVNGGDLSNLEAMLLNQATALQTIFTSLAKRAANQEHLRQYEAFLGLALKAQAQSRSTISALVDLKFPRQATFVRQANIAHGPQQVNNGAASPSVTSTHAPVHAGEMKPEQSKLLERQHGERMDTRKTCTASGADPYLEAVEPVHRPTDNKRKGRGV